MCIGLVVPFPYIAQGIPFSGDIVEECKTTLMEAIANGNTRLSSSCTVEVFDKEADFSGDILLTISDSKGTRPIDMIRIKALDEVSRKPLTELADEIYMKVKNHLAAEAQEGFLFTEEGTKLDLRRLNFCTFSIDTQGYLTINQSRIVFLTDTGYSVLKAEQFHSYTILRVKHFLESKTTIRIFDDFDLIRPDRLGMSIDMTAACEINLEQIMGHCLDEAAEYRGGYYILERDELTDNIRQGLEQSLRLYEAP